MLSPAGLSLVSDTLIVTYPLYPDIANPKEITKFKFLLCSRDTEYKMISPEKKVPTYCVFKKKYSIAQHCPK